MTDIGYWMVEDSNFGDLITPYIYNKITGKELVHIFAAKKNSMKLNKLYVCCGSILNQCRRWDTNIILWGTGINVHSSRFKREISEGYGNLTINSVRGPLTRNLLIDSGYECPEIYGDIGLLLPMYYKPNIKITCKIGLIPHINHYDNVSKKYKDDLNVSVINLRTNDIEKTIDEILECDILASSSPHGIIVSHAYNKKCAWFTYGHKKGYEYFKYIDYYKSIGGNGSIEPTDTIKDPNTVCEYNNIIPIDLLEIDKQDTQKCIDNFPNPSFPLKVNDIIATCPF